MSSRAFLFTRAPAPTRALQCNNMHLLIPSPRVRALWPARRSRHLMLCATVALAGCDATHNPFAGPKTAFDGTAALAYATKHLELGPRMPGTAAHDRAADWIIAQAKQRADTVIVQRWTQTTRNGTKLGLQNILARFNPQAQQRVLYLTHWDTRPTADEDPTLGHRAQPILGANDGAAGVGLFLALADVFHETPPAVGVDLLFVDGEDWGDFNADSSGSAWPDALFGSQYFASHPSSASYQPLFGVLFDLIGSEDLHLWQEETSRQRAPEVVGRVWSVAKELGYGSYFRDQVGQPLIDDQVPLLNRGWHVIDVVSWPYGVLPKNAGPFDQPNPPYHHTLEDTIDKLSARSLQVVGDVAVALVR